MNTYLSVLKKCVGLLIAASATSAALGQGTLIGPSIRNGSFEDGILAPWGSGHDVRVLYDPAFASDGVYYASFQSSLVLPVLVAQGLQPDSVGGLTFMLSFDARMGTPGLDQIGLIMGGRTPGGDPLNASVVPVTTPPLSDSAWQNYQYQLLLPSAWDPAGLSLGIVFSKNQPLGGVAHYAYLDNVVLTQIPEPSALALVGVASLLFGGWRCHWRRGAA